MAPIRAAIIALLRHILSSRILFQHDGDEIELWLDSLPLIRRAPGAQAPDGAPLLDESDGVISFLDDCVQRCIKTPYKYFEELQVLTTSSTTDGANGQAPSLLERPEEYPSPLLATVLEQLGAKLKGNLLEPSDALAVVTFLRKLVLHLVGKCPNLAWANVVSNQMASMANTPGLFLQWPVMLTALRCEARLLEVTLAQLRTPSPVESVFSTSQGTQEFLAGLEKDPEGTSSTLDVVRSDLSKYTSFDLDWSSA